MKKNELRSIKDKLMRFNKWLMDIWNDYDIDSPESKIIKKIGDSFGNRFNKHMPNEGFESMEGKWLNKMKFKKTKEGNMIVPIIKGHLVVPITDKKYEIFSDCEMELTKKDFEKIDGRWDDVFKRLYDNRLTKRELTSINFYMPDVIYEKLKKDKPKLFKEADFMKIRMMNVFKDYPKKREVIININLDLLKEFKEKKSRVRK